MHRKLGDGPNPVLTRLIRLTKAGGLGQFRKLWKAGSILDLPKTHKGRPAADLPRDPARDRSSYPVVISIPPDIAARLKRRALGQTYGLSNFSSDRPSVAR